MGFQEEMKDEDYDLFRKYLIDLVLSTDMAVHLDLFMKIQNKIDSDDWDPSKGADKQVTMNYLIHLADISNPTKKWDLVLKWTDMLFVEFFAQGDKEREKGLSVSYLMDRQTTNIARAQVGFIDNLIYPSFNVLAAIFPKAETCLDTIEFTKS